MDMNLIWVLVGVSLIGAGASLVGCFSFLRRQALVGDAVAHALLPGIALSFLIFEQKQVLYLFPGALLAGWLSLLSIEAIQSKSRIKPDTAVAIVLSVFFAVGIVLLTHIQQSGAGNQSGLDAFLFGKAASMLPRDIVLFATVDALLVLVVLLYYRYFKVYAFDPVYAHAIGLPVWWIRFLLATLTVLAVATGIQAVGVVLMAALIITPAAAARFLGKSLGRMLAYSIAIGISSAVLGTLISYTAPAMPTGPWIVLVLSALALLTFTFAPGKGMWHRAVVRGRHEQKVMNENILKTLYQEVEKGRPAALSLSALTAQRRFESQQLLRAIKRLQRAALLERTATGVELTATGVKEGARVVRLHRLWELYLHLRLNLAEDHVHHDAEAIEHIITPELERALLRELNYPNRDPHASLIPGVHRSSNNHD